MCSISTALRTIGSRMMIVPAELSLSLPRLSKLSDTRLMEASQMTPGKKLILTRINALWYYVQIISLFGEC